MTRATAKQTLHRHPRWIAAAALTLMIVQASVVAAAVEVPSSSTTPAESASSAVGPELLVPTASAPPASDSPTIGRWGPQQIRHDLPVVEAPGPPPAATVIATSTVFASVDGLDLHLPTATPTAIGYHEARAEHLAMTPLGASAGNWGLGATPEATFGPDYVIMPSRERDGAPTSAVDVVMPAGTTVLSPVAGTVVSVGGYLLYDEHEDIQIRIVPAGRPDLVVTVFHVSDVHVRIGQRVEVGDAIAGSARVFDFIAQVEAWGRGPHVDLRIHRA